jgi:phage-related protein
MAHLYFNTEKSVFQFDPTLRNVVWKTVSSQRVFYEGASVIPPSYGSPKEPVIALDKVKFGDGYEQVALAGLNPVQDVFNLNFNKKRRVVAVAMERFFKGEPEGSIYARNVSEWFWWLPPYPYAPEGSLPIKVLCDRWNLTPDTWDSVNISATFTQSFEP